MVTEPAFRAAGALIFAVAALITGCGDSNSQADGGPASATTTKAPTRATAVTGTTSSSTTPTVDPYAGVSLIDHLEWTENYDGPRVMVHPTEAGRTTTYPGSELRAWAEVRTLDPAVDSPGMWDQFRCHWEWARVIAPDKATWNLEPLRPPVGYDATVDAACNPGGPER